MGKEANIKMDRRVRSAVSRMAIHKPKRITFGMVIAEVQHSGDTRVIDRSLQRLRKNGELSYHSTEGWRPLVR